MEESNLIKEIRRNKSANRANSGFSLVEEIKRTRSAAGGDSVVADEPEISGDDHTWSAGSPSRGRRGAKVLFYAALITSLGVGASYGVKQHVQAEYQNRLETKVSRLEERYHNKLDSIKADVENLGEDVESKSRLNSTLERKTASLRDRLESAQDELEEKNQLNSSLKDRIASLKREISNYEEMSENKELIERSLNEIRRRTNPATPYSFEGISMDDAYNMVVVERDMNIPFNISNIAMAVAQEMNRSNMTDEQKAKKIFQWINVHVSYGKKMRGGAGYRNSEEVAKTKEGVCGEMAYLYVTMARLAKLEANYVFVSRDNKGKKVRHACAGVRIGGELILADPAYHTYDIHHQEYRVLDDETARSRFVRMRR